MAAFLLVVVWMCVWMCICIYTYIPKNIDAACLVFAMLLVLGGGETVYYNLEVALRRSPSDRQRNFYVMQVL